MICTSFVNFLLASGGFLVTISETYQFNTTHRPGEGCGSVMWMAPELFSEGIVKSRTSDVYALGMTIIEVYTGKPPLFGKKFTNSGQIIFAIMTGFRPESARITALNCAFPDELWSFAKRCWDQDLRCRPNMAEVVIELELCLRDSRKLKHMDII